MNRVVIIGATSAIAGACARLWAAQGASLFLVARDTEKLDALVGDLTVRGASASHKWQMDANDLPAHPLMLDAVLQSMGGLDIVLIAHGTLPDQAACEADAMLALREFHTNGTSVIALLTLLANQFERQGSGAIGVITSVAGVRGRPSNYACGSANAAVSTFCEGLRARLFKSGVSVTDIRPGFVATPMTESLSLPAMLVAEPDAVGRLIVAGIGRGADVLYTPRLWRVLMAVIQCIPGFVFKRMAL